MTDQKPTCPAPRSRVIDLYFMEHRAKLIEIAAFLDRLERAEDDLGREDYRVEAFRDAIKVLVDGKPQRAKRVLDLFSDPTETPIPSAADLKGAYGAWQGARDEGP